MGTFNAGTAVEAMNWDFTDFGGGSGVIPEPSTEQMDDFLEGLSEIGQKYADIMKIDTSTMDKEEVAALIAQFKDVKSSDLTNTIANICAKVCSDNPSAEEIRRLPFRPQQAFIGFLVGELRPEGRTATTKR